MGDSGTIDWRGWGRWLSLGTAGLLILLAVAGMLIGLRRGSASATEASAGWDLFLGLILFGTIISGSRRAPFLATVVAFLMAIRVVLGMAIGRPVIGVLIDVVLMLVVGFAALDLRRQTKTV